MIVLLQAEYIKLKKKIYFVMILVILLDIICVNVVIQSISNEQFRFDIFSVYYNSYGIIFIISYMVIGLLGFTLFYNEFKNNMIKQLLTTSITNTDFIASKLFTVFLFSELVMLVYAIQLIATVFIRNIPFELSDLLFIVLLSMLDGFLFFIAVLPLFLIFINLKDNAVVSIVSIIVYALSIGLASMGLVHIDILGYFHPLMNIVFIHNYFLFHHIPIAEYGILESALNNINISLAVTSIILFSFIFCILIKVSFKRIRK